MGRWAARLRAIFLACVGARNAISARLGAGSDMRTSGSSDVRRDKEAADQCAAWLYEIVADGCVLARVGVGDWQVALALCYIQLLREFDRTRQYSLRVTAVIE